MKCVNEHKMSRSLKICGNSGNSNLENFKGQNNNFCTNLVVLLSA